MTEQRAVPDHVFAALAAGGGGEDAIRLLVRGQQGKHRALLRKVITMAAEIGHPRAARLAGAYDLLARAQAERPAYVEPLLRHPPVGAWMARAWRDLRTGADIDYGYLTALAAVAALMAGSTCEVEIPLDGNALFLPFLGRADLSVDCPPSEATVRIGPGGAEIIAGGTCMPIPSSRRVDRDGWRGIRGLTVRCGQMTTSFLLDDLDPYRFPGADTTGRLDAVAVRHWQRALDKAWAVLVTHHRQTAEEIAAGLTVLVPLRARRGRHSSATSRLCFGAVGLSSPTHDHAVPAALAHERQHSKLGALLDLVALIDGTGGDCRYAPWRDDPRPLSARLQGAYAHLGVAGFWRQQRHVDAGAPAQHGHTEFARWRDDTREVVQALRASGALTPPGMQFVAGMAATLDGWQQDTVPATAIRAARAASDLHRASWQLRNSGPSG